MLSLPHASPHTPSGYRVIAALVKGIAQTGFAKAAIPQNNEEAELLAAFRAKKAAEAAATIATTQPAPFEPPAPVVTDDEVF